MDLIIDAEWLKEAVERQGDISDPAPYLTGRDVKAREAWRAEQEAKQRNGTANGSLHVIDADAPTQGMEIETKVAA